MRHHQTRPDSFDSPQPPPAPNTQSIPPQSEHAPPQRHAESQRARYVRGTAVVITGAAMLAGVYTCKQTPVVGPHAIDEGLSALKMPARGDSRSEIENSQKRSDPCSQPASLPATVRDASPPPTPGEAKPAQELETSHEEEIIYIDPPVREKTPQASSAPATAAAEVPAPVPSFDDILRNSREYSGRGEHEKALALLESAQVSDPAQKASLLAQIVVARCDVLGWKYEACAQDGQLEQSITAALQALHEAKKIGDPLHQYVCFAAGFRIKEKDPSAALAFFEKAAACDSLPGWQYVTIATHLARHGEDGLQRALLLVTSAASRGEPEVLKLQGVLLERKLQADKALINFDGAQESARRWWNDFEKANLGNRALMLKTLEPIIAANCTLDDFFLAYVYADTNNIAANLHYMNFRTLREETSFPLGGAKALRFANREYGAIPSKPSLQCQQEARAALRYEDASPDAKKWWEMVERVSSANSTLLLRHAEALRKRTTSLEELFHISARCDTDNLAALVSFRDYIELQRANRNPHCRPDTSTDAAAVRAYQARIEEAKLSRKIGALSQSEALYAAGRNNLFPSDPSYKRTNNTSFIDAVRRVRTYLGKVAQAKNAQPSATTVHHQEFESRLSAELGNWCAALVYYEGVHSDETAAVAANGIARFLRDNRQSLGNFDLLAISTEISRAAKYRIHEKDVGYMILMDLLCGPDGITFEDRLLNGSSRFAAQYSQ